MITAILRAQWRSMRTFRTGANPAAVAVSWLSGLLFYGFWAAAAFGAQEFFRNPANAHLFPLVLSAALLVILFYWQITPVITASMGASLDLKKLLAYPIPHTKLFIVELLLRLTTCAEMLLVLAGIVIGLARNPQSGGLVQLPRLLGTALLFIALNISLSAAVRNGLERLLLRKRMKEVLMFVLIAVTIAPQFLVMKGYRPKDLDSGMLPDAPYLPWSATSHLFLASGYVIPLLVLLSAVVGTFFLARWQFETNLRMDSSSTASGSIKLSDRSERWELFFRWPARVFPDPFAAIMEKEFRSLVRTPQFRIVFITGSAFGLLLFLPQLLNNHRRPDSFMSQNILPMASVYAVLILGQVSYFNCFGYDRSAAQAWFSYPVSFTHTLVAKNLSALCFIFIEIMLVITTGAALRIPVTPGKLIENIAVSFISVLYLMAFGNMASVRIPRPLVPERISQGGATKAMNAVVLIAMPIVLLPIGLAYWARSVFQNQVIFAVLLTFAALLGAVLYKLGLTSAVSTANARREKILTDLSRGEGPISIT